MKLNRHILSILVLIIVSLPSCEDRRPTVKADQKLKSATLNPSAAKLHAVDTLINTPCALLIYPTIEQINQLKKEAGSDSTGFYTVADDNQYYMGMAGIFLDSVKTKTFSRDAKGLVTFKTAKEQTYKLSIDSLKWSVILFNGKDKPKNTDLTMIEEEYWSYMKK